MFRGAPSIGCSFCRLPHIEARHALEQPERVRVPRMGEYLLGAARLDERARIHDVHPLAHAGDDTQVVRDHDQGGVAVGDEVAQQVEDLCLDRDVERGCRLVGDQQLRLAGKSHRDHRALPHPTRELMGVVAQPGLRARDADLVEQVDRASVAALPSSSSACGVASPSCFPIVSTGFRLVIGSWKMIPISLAADPLQLARSDSASNSRPSTRALPRRPARRGAGCPSARARDALAAPGLADQAEGLAGADAERDAVHGVDDAALGREVDVEVVDLEERRPRRHDRPAASGRAPLAARRRSG